MFQKILLKKSKKKGFTLIEMLIVIAIVGILASLMLVNYMNQLKKSRDRTRQTDVNAIKLAANLCYDKERDWPATLGALKTGGYLSTIPTDPKTNVDYVYFRSDAACSGACSINYTLETAGAVKVCCN